MPDAATTADRVVPVPLALPPWLDGWPVGDPTGAAIAAGAALASLHPLVAALAEDVPAALWRERMALAAAEAAAMRDGARTDVAAMRDETHLSAPGIRPGPAGGAFALQRRAASLPLGSTEGLRAHGALAEGLALRVPGWDGGCPGADPPRAAAAALERLLAQAGCAERAAAVMLADATLAAGLGWPHAPPLLGIGLRRGDLGLRGEALRIACLAAIIRAAPQAVALARELACRAAALRAAATRLRARAAEDAVRLFLMQDAAVPQRDLCPVVRGGTARMSQRAARRLCQRLVALGGLRELTGRTTHRLYGL